MPSSDEGITAAIEARADGLNCAVLARLRIVLEAPIPSRPRIHCHAMSDLTPFERSSSERLSGMESGYVLNSPPLVLRVRLGDDQPRHRYLRYGGGSKASRLRAFWRMSRITLCKLTQAMIDTTQVQGFPDDDNGPCGKECRRIQVRLAQGTPVRN